MPAGSGCLLTEDLLDMRSLPMIVVPLDRASRIGRKGQQRDLRMKCVVLTRKVNPICRTLTIEEMMRSGDIDLV